jgi:uncharacterized protein (TIGR03000 family)
MFPLRSVRSGGVLLVVGFAASGAAAQPAQGLQPRFLPPPLSNPQGLSFTPGTGYGTGLYGPLGYGLGYSPFGYSGLPYGGVGYGALGYGYGYPGSVYGPYSGSYLNRPAIPRIESSPYRSVPARPLSYPSVAPTTPVMPAPLLPEGIAPAPAANAATATLTVKVPAGAAVTFDGTASPDSGATRVYTTPPINPGAETRVRVTVTIAGKTSTITIRLRAGEKVTIDMTR